MELGPILRAMMRSKVRFGLIAAQIAVTLAIVANCMALILDARRKMVYPKSFDEDDQIWILLPCPDTALRDDRRRSLWAREHLDRLRGIAGVRAVSSTSFAPFFLTRRGIVRPAGSAAGMTFITAWIGDDQLPVVIGAQLDEGRWYSHEEVERLEDLGIAEQAKPRARGPDGKVLEPIIAEVVITRALGEHLFGEGPLAGKMLEDSDGDLSRVVGVVGRYHAPTWSTIRPEHAAFYPGYFHPYKGGAWFVARAEPGQAAVVAHRIEEELSKTQEIDEGAVRLLSEGRDIQFGRQQATVTLMGLLIVLLLFVASLVVAGLTSFSVTARAQQIGIRRALGATTGDILRYFLTENVLLTTMGLLIGTGLAVALNIALRRVYEDAKLGAPVVGGSALVLFLVGLGAALPPALRASRTSPAIATRNV